MAPALGCVPFRMKFAKKRKLPQQTESLFFFKLPLKIRLYIYELAIPDEARDPGIELLHVLKAIDCDQPHGHDTTLYSALVRRLTAIDTLGLYGAMLSCQKMYCEALPVLYSNTTFHLSTFSRLSALPSLLPRPSLSHISHLSLHLPLKSHDFDPYYISAADSRLVVAPDHPSLTLLLTRLTPRHGTVLALDKLLAAHFPKLRTLKVGISRRGGYVSEGWEREVLSPVWGVKNRGLVRFVVVVDWDPVTVALGREYVTKGGARIVVVKGE